MAFGEIAEDDRATVALAKFGVTAEEAAEKAHLLYNLKLFTGDAVSAAELYGRVINGNTRGLEQYGIKLEETASREERLAALQTLGARGRDQQIAQLDTITGNWELMKQGIGENLAEMITLGNALSVMKQWNQWQYGITDSMIETAKETRKLAGDAGLLREPVQDAEKALSGLNDELDETSQRAARASSNLDRVLAAATRFRLAEINEDEAKGAITPEEAEIRRAQVSGDAEVTDIARKKQSVKGERSNIQARSRAIELDATDEGVRQKAIEQAADISEEEKKAARDTYAKAKREQLNELAKRDKALAEEQEALEAEERAAHASRSASIAKAQRASQDAAQSREAAAKKEIGGIQERKAERQKADQEERIAGEKAAAEARAQVGESLNSGTAGFLNEFSKPGHRLSAAEAAKEAKKRAEKRLSKMSPEEAEKQAEDVLREEQDQFIKSDKRTGERSLKGREFQSKADRNGSGLNQLQAMQRPAKATTGSQGNNAAPASGGLEKAAAGLGSIDPVLGKVLSLMATVASAMKTTQGKLSQLQSKVDGLDHSISK